MLKVICAVAFVTACAAPAFAQKTDLPDRPVKQITPFDQAPIKEGIQTLKLGGECTVQYIVDTKGKAKDITTDCSVPEMGPYVVRTIESGEWESEITGGEFFDSYPIKQAFKFGPSSAPAVDPRGEKSPVMLTGVEQRDITRAINQVDQEGKCAVKFTIGADGKPKDIVPGCEPAAYDAPITEAVKSMEFKPGIKDGQPTDWPGMSMPINLTKPKGS